MSGRRPCNSPNITALFPLFIASAISQQRSWQPIQSSSRCWPLRSLLAWRYSTQDWFGGIALSIGPADQLIEAAKNYQHPIGFTRMGLFGRKLLEMMTWIAK